MKININAGHTLTGGDTGASGLKGLREEKLTRELAKEVQKVANAKGIQSHIVAIDHANTLNDSLFLQKQGLNAHKVDYNIILHFNASANHFGNGSEIFTHQGKQLPQAKRILENLEKLGFNNRGIKQQELYLINATNDETLYIEVAFIDNLHDVHLIEQKGLNQIANAIVSGLLGTEMSPVASKTYRNLIVYNGEVDKVAATILSWGLENSFIISEQEYKKGLIKGTSIYSVGGANVGVDVVLRGSNRYDTIKMVLKRLKQL